MLTVFIQMEEIEFNHTSAPQLQIFNFDLISRIDVATFEDVTQTNRSEKCISFYNNILFAYFSSVVPLSKIYDSPIAYTYIHGYKSDNIALFYFIFSYLLFPQNANQYQSRLQNTHRHTQYGNTRDQRALGRARWHVKRRKKKLGVNSFLWIPQNSFHFCDGLVEVAI